MYSEIVSVTDVDGQIAWGRTHVVVVRAGDPTYHAPGIHATYHPTLNLQVDQPITFKVRTFGMGKQAGGETWDFGDGSQPVLVHSDGGSRGQHAPDGYAVTTHRFQEAGTYIVSVTRETTKGEVVQERMALEIE